MLVSNGLGALVLSLAATFGLPSAPAKPVSGRATTHEVKMVEIRPGLGKLSCLKGDPLVKERVEYVTSGKANYDDVSKNAAEIQAGMVLSNAFAGALTTDLKAYARSYAASKQTDKNVQEILGKSKPEAMNDDQAIALLKLKKGQLTADELNFATSAAIDAASVVGYLGAAGTRAKPLATKAASLAQTVNTDFAGAEAIKAPLVLKSMQASAKNMKDAVLKAPELAKALTRLAQGLKSLQ